MPTPTPSFLVLEPDRIIRPERASFGIDKPVRWRNHRILKVQLPLETNDPEPKALLYDEGREYLFFYLLSAQDPLIEMVGQEPSRKKYYSCTTRAGRVILESEAPEQDW